MIVRVVRPVFAVRRSLLVLGMIVVGWAFPAASVASVNPCGQSDVQAACQIKTVPIRIGGKGFKLTLSISQHIIAGYGGVYKGNLFSAVLVRHRGHATESDSYSFYAGTRDHPLRFRWGGKRTKHLQFAKITGRFGGRRGSIDLTFHPTGPAHHVSVPRGCRGHGGQLRPGALSGSFSLHADKLGTITKKSLRASISTADYVCSSLAHSYGVKTDASHGLPLLYVSKPSSTGPVSETINAFGEGPGGLFSYEYTVSGLPSSNFTFNPSTLNTGRVTGAGGISGTATYSSTSSSDTSTTGRMRGNLAVRFASIGKVSPFPRGRAAEEWAPSANE